MSVRHLLLKPRAPRVNSMWVAFGVCLAMLGAILAGGWYVVQRGEAQAQPLGAAPWNAPPCHVYAFHSPDWRGPVCYAGCGAAMAPFPCDKLTDAEVSVRRWPVEWRQ